MGFQARGGVTGHTFVDTDGDGYSGRESAVTGTVGTTVTLTPAVYGTIRDTTDAAGNYSFTNAAGGNACVAVSVPAGLVLTTGNNPQNVTVTASRGPQPPERRASSTGARSRAMSSTTPTATACTAGASLRSPVRAVTVTDEFGGVHSTVTDTNGDHVVTGVPAGATSHTRDVTQTYRGTRRATTSNDPQTVTVTGGGSATARHLSVPGPGRCHRPRVPRRQRQRHAGGRRARPDRRDRGTLTPSAGGPHTASTDGNGNYTLPTVAGGTASLDVTDPAGHVLTTANNPQSVTVTTSGAGTTQPVGFQAQGTVQGHVFVDTDGNGVQNGGEVALPGRAVTVADRVRRRARGQNQRPALAAETTASRASRGRPARRRSRPQ